MRATLRRLWRRQEVRAAVFIAVPAIIGAALGIKLALPDGLWPALPGQPVTSSSSRKEPPSTRPKSSAEISGGTVPHGGPQRSPTSQPPSSTTQPAPKEPRGAGPASTASEQPTKPSSGPTSFPSTRPTPSTTPPTPTNQTTTSSQPEQPMETRQP